MHPHADIRSLEFIHKFIATLGKNEVSGYP